MRNPKVGMNIRVPASTCIVEAHRADTASMAAVISQEEHRHESVTVAAKVS